MFAVAVCSLMIFVCFYYKVGYVKPHDKVVSTDNPYEESAGYEAPAEQKAEEVKTNPFNE